MKMTPAHYADLKARIRPLTSDIRVHRTELEAQHRNPSPLLPKVKDVERRLRWDAFHASRIQSAYSYQDFDYTDAQIETAMRAAFKDLGV